MHALVFHLLTALTSATSQQATLPENTLLKELTQQGVIMPNKTVIKLPAPTMKEGMTAEEQAAAMAAVARLNNRTLEKFIEPIRDAPVAYKIKTIQSGEETFRTMDFYFVVHGDWDVLTSQKFVDSVVKIKNVPGNPIPIKKGDEAQQVSEIVRKAGYLKDDEITKRGLIARSGPDLKEFYLYTTLRLFEMVEVSNTRYILVTKTPSGAIVAGKTDPRFAKDKEYPNQWQRIIKNALGQAQLGKPNPYSGTGFYVKVTRLIQPANAIFVEYHGVYNEPFGWFDGEPTLRSKLPLIAGDRVKQFRAKLARMCAEKAKQNQAAPKASE